MNKTQLENNFIKFINSNFLFENKPTLAVAVSGGSDSIALVFLLKEWIKFHKGNLIALIVDHQIRKHSSFEAKSVSQYLQKNNIKNVILKISKKRVLKGKMSQARNNRFSIMTNYCKKNKIFYLFMAHHKDDDIETFLLRKLAGSNLEGLNSMKEKTIFNSIQIIRPLLKSNKKQIINYNNKYKLQNVFDPSNQNTKYSRVVIRNYINSNLAFRKEALKDFKLVKDNYKSYIKMIYHIYNSVVIQIYKNKIVFDSNLFFNLKIELQIKLVEINFKFFNNTKPFVRSAKIADFLKNLSKESKFSYKIANMQIRYEDRFIYFLVKR